MTAVRRLFLLGDASAYAVYCRGVSWSPQVDVRRSSSCYCRLKPVGENTKSGITQAWLDSRWSRVLSSVFPDAQVFLDTARAATLVQSATGIFMGGGNTRAYHQLYTSGQVATAIRESYARGIPIAGVVSRGTDLTAALSLVRQRFGRD